MALHSEVSDVTLTGSHAAAPLLAPCVTNVSVQEGDDVTLTVPLAAHSGAPTQVSWTRGDVELSGERFSSGTHRGTVTLNVRNASVGDSGRYSLSARNDAGHAHSDLLLEVRTRPGDVPVFLRRLNDLAVKVGTRTRFLVEIRSPTQVKVSWEQEGKPVVESERFHLLHEGNFFCVDVAPVTLEDAGLWICRAHNSNGTATCFCHLNVLVPKAYKGPHFIEELVAILTEQGTVSLECKVVGVPTPTLRWFKDNQEIKAGDVFALTANPQDTTTLGTYTCEATNCMGRAYSTSRVHVLSKEGSVQPVDSLVPKGPAPVFSKELQSEKVKIGGKLTLLCKVSVPPWPKSITWFNKAGLVESGGRYRIIEDGLGTYSIEVDPVEAVEEGDWKCVATSHHGVKGISTCNVTVSYPKNYRKPKFLESLKAILTEEGLVSFECKVVGYPTPQLRWFKDGQELKPGDVYQLTGTNSLGSYCCIAKNCMGETSSTAELTVEDIQSQLNEEERLQLFSKNQPPRFLQGLRSLESKIMDPLRFTVQVSVSPQPSVAWYRDDEEIQESDRYKKEQETKGFCHLTIKRLELMDQAEWKCVATNDYGQSVTSCFLKLAVPRHYKKPRFLENLRAVLSEEGAVNLECKVIGVPQPTLKWYKDGRELKPGDIHRIISGQDGTCCLGTYTCEATNCMGSVSSSASLLGFEDRAQVKPQPEPLRPLPPPAAHLVRHPSLSTILEERTSQLHDTVASDERAEVSFSFDGKEVSVSLYETPDLTEEEALQVVEMYAEELSEHISGLQEVKSLEHNVVELPPMRFVKETSQSGHLLMEAVVIDVSPEYYASAEDRTEADLDEFSITEDNGFMSPQVLTPEEMPFDKFTADFLERTTQSEQKAVPVKPPRKRGTDNSESSYHSLKEAKLSPEEESSEFADALSSIKDKSQKDSFGSEKSGLEGSGGKEGQKIRKAEELNLQGNEELSGTKKQRKKSRSRSRSAEVQSAENVPVTVPEKKVLKKQLKKRKSTDSEKEDDSLREFERQKSLKTEPDQGTDYEKLQQKSNIKKSKSSESEREDDSLQEFESRKSLIKTDTKAKPLQRKQLSDSSGKEDDSLIEYEKKKMSGDGIAEKTSSKSEKQERQKASLSKSISTDSSEKDDAFAIKSEQSEQSRKRKKKSIKKSSSTEKKTDTPETGVEIPQSSEAESCDRDSLKNKRVVSTSDLDRMRSTSDLDSIGDKSRAQEEEEHSADFDTAEDSAYDKSEMSVLESLTHSITEIKKGLAAVEEKIISESTDEPQSAKSSLSAIESLVQPLNEIQRGLIVVEKQAEESEAGQYSPSSILETLKEPIQELGRNLAEIEKVKTTEIGDESLLKRTSQTLLETVSHPLQELEKELTFIQQQAIIELGEESYSDVLQSFKPSLLVVQGGVEHTEGDFTSKLEDLTDITVMPQSTYARQTEQSPKSINELSGQKSLVDEQNDLFVPLTVLDVEESLAETAVSFTTLGAFDLNNELQTLSEKLEKCLNGLNKNADKTSDGEVKDILVSLGKLVMPLEQFKNVIEKCLRLVSDNDKSNDPQVRSSNMVIKATLESPVHALGKCINLLEIVASSKSNKEIRGLGIKILYKLSFPLEELKTTMKLIENLSEHTSIELLVAPVENLISAASVINLEASKSGFAENIPEEGGFILRELNDAVGVLENSVASMTKGLSSQSSLHTLSSLVKPLTDLQKSLHKMENEIKTPEKFNTLTTTEIYNLAQDLCKPLQAIRTELSIAQHEIELDQYSHLSLLSDSVQDNTLESATNIVHQSLEQVLKSVLTCTEFVLSKSPSETLYVRYLLFALNELILPLNQLNTSVAKAKDTISEGVQTLVKPNIGISAVSESASELLDVLSKLHYHSISTKGHPEIQIIQLLCTMQEPLMQVERGLSKIIENTHEEDKNILNINMLKTLAEPFKYLQKSLINIYENLRPESTSQEIFLELRHPIQELQRSILIIQDQVSFEYGDEPATIESNIVTLQSLMHPLNALKKQFMEINNVMIDKSQTTSYSRENKNLHSVIRVSHELQLKLSSIMVEENYVNKHSLDSLDMFPLFQDLTSLLRDFENALRRVDLMCQNENKPDIMVYNKLCETVKLFKQDASNFHSKICLASAKANNDVKHPVHSLKRGTETFITKFGDIAISLENCQLDEQSLALSTLQFYQNLVQNLKEFQIFIKEADTFIEDSDKNSSEISHLSSSDTIKDVNTIMEEVTQTRVSLESSNIQSSKNTNLQQVCKDVKTFCECLKSTEESMIDSTVTKANLPHFDQEDERRALTLAFSSMVDQLKKIEKHIMGNPEATDSINYLINTIEVIQEHLNSEGEISEVDILKKISAPLKHFKDNISKTLDTASLRSEETQPISSYLEKFEKSSSDLELGLMKLEHALLNSTGDFSSLKNIDIDVLANPIEELEGYINSIEEQYTAINVSESIGEQSSLSMLKTLAQPIREIKEGVLLIQEQIVLETSGKTPSGKSCAGILYEIAKPIRELRSGVALIQEQIVMEPDIEPLSDETRASSLQTLAVPIEEMKKVLSNITEQQPLIFEADAQSMSENISLLKTIAQPVKELQNKLASIEINQVMESGVESISVKENLLTLAKPVQTLQESIAQVESQIALETIGDDLSLQNSITMLKKLAKPLIEISQEIAIIFEQQFIEDGNVEDVVSISECSTLANLTDVTLTEGAVRVGEVMTLEQGLPLQDDTILPQLAKTTVEDNRQIGVSELQQTLIKLDTELENKPEDTFMYEKIDPADSAHVVSEILSSVQVQEQGHLSHAETLTLSEDRTLLVANVTEQPLNMGIQAEFQDSLLHAEKFSTEKEVGKTAVLQDVSLNIAVQVDEQKLLSGAELLKSNYDLSPKQIESETLTPCVIQGELQQSLADVESLETEEETLESISIQDTSFKFEPLINNIQEPLSNVEDLTMTKNSLCQAGIVTGINEAVQHEALQTLDKEASLKSLDKSSTEANISMSTPNTAAETEIQQLISNLDDIKTNLVESDRAKINEVSLKCALQVECQQILSDVETLKTDSVSEKMSQAIGLEESNLKVATKTQIQEFLSVAEQIKMVKNELQIKVTHEPLINETAKQEIQQVLQIAEDIISLQDEIQVNITEHPKDNMELPFEKVIVTCEKVKILNESIQESSREHTEIQKDMETILSLAKSLEYPQKSSVLNIPKESTNTLSIIEDLQEVLPSKNEKENISVSNITLQSSELQAKKLDLKQATEAPLQQFIIAVEDMSNSVDTLHAKLLCEPTVKFTIQQELQEIISVVDDIKTMKNTLEVPLKQAETMNTSIQEIQQILVACGNLEKLKELVETKMCKELNVYSAVESEIQQILLVADSFKAIKHGLLANIIETGELDSIESVQVQKVILNETEPERNDEAQNKIPRDIEPKSPEMKISEMETGVKSNINIISDIKEEKSYEGEKVEVNNSQNKESVTEKEGVKEEIQDQPKITTRQNNVELRDQINAKFKESETDIKEIFALKDSSEQHNISAVIEDTTGQSDTKQAVEKVGVEMKETKVESDSKTNKKVTSDNTQPLEPVDGKVKEGKEETTQSSVTTVTEDKPDNKKQAVKKVTKEKSDKNQNVKAVNVTVESDSKIDLKPKSDKKKPVEQVGVEVKEAKEELTQSSARTDTSEKSDKKQKVEAVGVEVKEPKVESDSKVNEKVTPDKKQPEAPVDVEVTEGKEETTQRLATTVTKDKPEKIQAVNTVDVEVKETKIESVSKDNKKLKSDTKQPVEPVGVVVKECKEETTESSAITVAEVKSNKLEAVKTVDVEVKDTKEELGSKVNQELKYDKKQPTEPVGVEVKEGKEETTQSSATTVTEEKHDKKQALETFVDVKDTNVESDSKTNQRVKSDKKQQAEPDGNEEKECKEESLQSSAITENKEKSNKNQKIEAVSVEVKETKVELDSKVKKKVKSDKKQPAEPVGNEVKEEKEETIQSSAITDNKEESDQKQRVEVVGVAVSDSKINKSIKSEKDQPVEQVCVEAKEGSEDTTQNSATTVTEDKPDKKQVLETVDVDVKEIKVESDSKVNKKEKSDKTQAAESVGVEVKESKEESLKSPAITDNKEKSDKNQKVEAVSVEVKETKVESDSKINKKEKSDKKQPVEPVCVEVKEGEVESLKSSATTDNKEKSNENQKVEAVSVEVKETKVESDSKINKTEKPDKKQPVELVGVEIKEGKEESLKSTAITDKKEKSDKSQKVETASVEVKETKVESDSKINKKEKSDKKQPVEPVGVEVKEGKEESLKSTAITDNKEKSDKSQKVETASVEVKETKVESDSKINKKEKPDKKQPVEPVGVEIKEGKEESLKSSATTDNKEKSNENQKVEAVSVEVKETKVESDSKINKKEKSDKKQPVEPVGVEVKEGKEESLKSTAITDNKEKSDKSQKVEAASVEVKETKMESDSKINKKEKPDKKQPVEPVGVEIKEGKEESLKSSATTDNKEKSNENQKVEAVSVEVKETKVESDSKINKKEKSDKKQPVEPVGVEVKEGKEESLKSTAITDNKEKSDKSQKVEAASVEVKETKMESDSKINKKEKPDKKQPVEPVGVEIKEGKEESLKSSATTDNKEKSNKNQKVEAVSVEVKETKVESDSKINKTEKPDKKQPVEPVGVEVKEGKEESLKSSATTDNKEKSDKSQKVETASVEVKETKVESDSKINKKEKSDKKQPVEPVGVEVKEGKEESLKSTAITDNKKKSDKIQKVEAASVEVKESKVESDSKINKKEKPDKKQPVEPVGVEIKVGKEESLKSSATTDNKEKSNENQKVEAVSVEVKETKVESDSKINQNEKSDKKQPVEPVGVEVKEAKVESDSKVNKKVKSDKKKPAELVGNEVKEEKEETIQSSAITDNKEESDKKQKVKAVSVDLKETKVESDSKVNQKLKSEKKQPVEQVGSEVKEAKGETTQSSANSHTEDKSDTKQAVETVDVLVKETKVELDSKINKNIKSDKKQKVEAVSIEVKEGKEEITQGSVIADTKDKSDIKTAVDTVGVERKETKLDISASKQAIENVSIENRTKHTEGKSEDQKSVDVKENNNKLNEKSNSKTSYKDNSKTSKDKNIKGKEEIEILEGNKRQINESYMKDKVSLAKTTSKEQETVTKKKLSKKQKDKSTTKDTQQMITTRSEDEEKVLSAEKEESKQFYLDESSTSDYGSESYSEPFQIKKSRSYNTRQWIYDSKNTPEENISRVSTKYARENKFEKPCVTTNEKITYTSRQSASKPLFCGRLVDRTAAQGSKLKVTCSMTGSPDPTVQWYKDGHPVDSSFDPRIRTRLSNGLASLEIVEAKVGDSGKYTCTARNTHGEASTTANIKVFSYMDSAPEAPVFTQHIRDHYKSASDELVIECRVKGHPQPLVAWTKDGTPLRPLSRYEQSVLTDGTCRLVIHGPEANDSGLYKCVAENAVWSEQTSAHVTFEGREKYLAESRSLADPKVPRFTNIVSDTVVREGGTLALQVAVKGTPRAEVTWYRGSEPLPKRSSRYRYLEDAGVYTLVMTEASAREAGTYTCRASNAYGYRDTSVNVEIVGAGGTSVPVRGKPAMFVSRPDTSMTIAVGEDVSFSFRVSGDPKPRVTWMKGMKDITNNIRTMKETVNDYVRLSLKHATVLDAGTYFIMAKNIYGADHAFVTVRVKQRARSLTPTRNTIWSGPDTSTILRDIHESTRALVNDVPGQISSPPVVSDSGKNWLSLSWGKPDHRGAAPVLAYRVESWLLGSEGGAQWTELGVTPINSFDVFFLKPGSEYKFRVTARNRYGWGESLTTTEPIPVGSVANFPPDIVQDLPGPLKALHGDDITLECEITGDPPPTIQWLRDGQNVGTLATLKDRVFVSDNQLIHRLIIKQLTEDDSGRYVCEAVNKIGRASTYARLLVVNDPRLLDADRKLKESLLEQQESVPQFTMRLRDRRVQASYPVRLSCQVLGSPTPVVSWACQGQPVIADDRHQILQEADHFHTLEITRTLLEDSGEYTATAHNGLGAVSCHCQLVVDKGIRAYISPEFTSELSPAVTVRDGGELRLFAQVEAYPTVSISWQRDGVRLRPSRRLVMTLDPEGRVELALAHITIRDAGLYTCTATNAVGRAETISQVFVTGGTAAVAEVPAITTTDAPYSKEPRFVTKPRSSEAVEGDTVVITCEVVGDPQPEVVWLRDWLKPGYYRDAPQFRQVGGGSQYSLEIPQVKLDFTGTYCVIARNPHGEAKAIISLQIYAKGQGKESSMVSGHVKHGQVETLPEIKRELRDVRCCDGDAVTLECVVSACPLPSVRWEKDGKILHLGEDIEAELDGEIARLTIKKVYPEDEGQYACVAYNDLGRAVTSACLVVDVPEEKETLLSQQLTRPPGLLSARSTPRSTPRNTPSPARSLSPIPARFREFSSPSFSRPKRVKMSSPKFYTVPHNRIAEEGETVRFQCSVAGHPTPWASWDKDGHIVTPSSRLSVTERDDLRTLELREVTVEDAGLYRVTLENEMGSVEATARLDIIGRQGSRTRSVRAWSGVRSSPTFGRRLVGSAARVGGTFTLTCDVHAAPSPVTSWYRNGEMLVKSPRVVPSWDGRRARLELRCLQPEDAGVYTCVAENAVGTTQCSAELRVLQTSDPSDADLQPPVFLQGLSPEQTAAEGQPFELQVRLQGSSPLEVVWVKDGVEVPDCPDLRHVDYGDGRFGLRIADVFVADGGIYNCEAFNDHGDAITSGHLIVNDLSGDQSGSTEPEIMFTKTPSPVLARLRGQASFCARLQSRPLSHTSFTWTVNGRSVNNVDRFTVTTEEDCSILHLAEVSPSDMGSVVCTARVCSPGVPPTTVSCDTMLGLDPSPGAPAVLLRGPCDTTAMRGDRVLLKATYRGDPEPSVRWLKAGRELTSEGRVQITSRDGVSCLTISAIDADDSGKYVVSVENIHGADCHFASVAVEGPPEAPAARPSVSTAGEGCVTVAWSSPPYDGGCVITGYRVEMRTALSHQWSVVAERCHSLSHVVRGLTPGQTYLFRVRAENIHGVSESSAESFPFMLQSPHKDLREEEVEGEGEVEVDEVLEPRLVTLEPGDQFLERYSVHEELGKGRYGVVHKVTDLRTGHTMAAKFVRCIKKQDREKVQEEIDIMNCLRHPKLLQLTAAFDNPKDMIMVMEYISGGELFERVVADDFTLTERDCILFLRQICEGVRYMHTCNVVHLDLKPENIMCHTRTSHRVKIIDFGLAQQLESNTPVRVLFGTPEFIPPEIINYEPIGVESDMWSVGVICYVLLSGLSPFMGDNDAETFANITRADFDFDDEAFEAISQDAKDFISSLLVKRKEKRLTAEECLRHKWLTQSDTTMSSVKLCTDKLKKFIIRRKWQKTGNAIRALGRMATLSAASRRNSSASSPPSPRPSLSASRMSSLGEEKEERARGRVCSERSDSGISDCSSINTNATPTTPCHLLNKKYSICEEPESDPSSCRLTEHGVTVNKLCDSVNGKTASNVSAAAKKRTTNSLRLDSEPVKAPSPTLQKDAKLFGKSENFQKAFAFWKQ